MAKKKEKEIKQDSALKARLDREWQSAQNNRNEFDWKWFTYDLFVSGNHYARWDNDTQQIVSSVKEKGQVKIVINKVFSTLRSVRNFVLRSRPRAEATPDDLTEENVEETNKLNRFLDFFHDKQRLRRKLKGTLWHALKYSVGYWQVLFDNVKKEIVVNEVDPYDLYWDPVARDPSEARYAILAVRRNVEDLRRDPKYDIPDDMKTDDLLSASSLKARFLQSEKGMSDFNEDKEGETVIVREHWYRSYEDEEYEEKVGKKKVKKTRKVPKIMIAAVAGNRIIRQPEDAKVDRIPFFRLSSDIEPLSMYGQGWVKNLISPNKLLDRLESSIAEWNDIMNKGKWVADKNAGVRIINNAHGQIIEKKRGFDVNQADIRPLSAVIFKQIENVNRYIEDIGGSHDAMLGRVPTGVKSGRGVEALQIGDMNNLSEVVENVEEFLEEVYEYVLYLASKKYQFARNVITVTTGGQREFTKVIGSSASNKPEGALVIKPNNIVDVKITSWLAQTNEAKREVLKELYQLQAIDQETLLEGYNIGSVSQVIQKTRKEKLENAATQIEVANQSNPQPAGPVPSGRLEAIAALKAIVNGAEPQPPQAVGADFIAYIDEYLESEEAQSLDSATLRAIQVFRATVAQQTNPGG